MILVLTVQQFGFELEFSLVVVVHRECSLEVGVAHLIEECLVVHGDLLS